MLMRLGCHIKLFLAMINVIDNIEHIVPEGETFKMVVTGRSMLPLLGYGSDTILVRRVTIDEDIFNRIAMFRSEDGRIIVHRVLCVVEDNVALKGDGNLQLTEVCRRSEIIGVVDRVIRRSGKVVDCTSRWWRIREHMWLMQPYFIRRCALALLHRWLNLIEKTK